MRIKQSRTFYTEEFRKKVLAVYYKSEESVAQLSERFDANIETVKSWYLDLILKGIKRVYLKRSIITSQ